ARLDLAVSPGPAGTPLLDGRLGLAGALLSGRGEVPTDARGVLRPALALTLDKADLARLFPAVAAAIEPGAAVPARFTARLTRPDEGWRLDTLAGSLAGTNLSGALAYVPAAVEPLDVTLKADRLGAARLLGFAAGRTGGTATPWPDGPFGPVPLPDVPARIGLALDALELPGGLALAPAYLRVRLGGGAVSVDEISGRIGEAPLSGSLKLRRRGEVLEAEGHAALNGVDLTRLAVAAGVGAKPGLRGRATLVLDVSGSGRSPAALAQSLAGQGSLAVDGFEVAGLDPRALAAVMAATERGNPPDARRTTQLFEQALMRGPLALPRFETPLSVLNGALRTGTARVTGAGGLRVSATGTLDLARLSFEAALELEDATEPRASAPPGALLSWRGPLAAPERRSDISALLAAINLRALERETRRLEAGYGRPPDPAGPRPIAVPP
ncbi:MAG TPA: AsmA-like C-terminal region-containing protein, partial [Xanthobacteraceae bacterium]|nr:AsmA-like C-terminal region-containing protein [Xanthobacteraceae bacterium]